MSLLFMDGCDHYDTDTVVGTKYVSKASYAVVSTSGGRFGGGALKLGTPGQWAGSFTAVFPAANALVVGCSYTFTAFYGSSIVFRLLSGAISQCGVFVNTNGSLEVRRGGVSGTAVTGGLSAAGIVTAGVWYRIECKVKLDDSIPAGSCEVRVNGATVLTVATGQDLNNAGGNVADGISILPGNIGGGHSNDTVDDIVVMDQSGSELNDWLGDVRIETIYPNGAGTHQDWSPSTGSDHAAVIDEAPPNTTDYIYSDTSSEKDTSALGNLGVTLSDIYAVQVNSYAAKDGAGDISIRNLIRSAGEDEVGATAALSSSWLGVSSIHTKDPKTDAAWSQSAVDALEAGVEVVA